MKPSSALEIIPPRAAESRGGDRRRHRSLPASLNKRVAVRQPPRRLHPFPLPLLPRFALLLLLLLASPSQSSPPSHFSPSSPPPPPPPPPTTTTATKTRARMTMILGRVGAAASSASGPRRALAIARRPPPAPPRRRRRLPRLPAPRAAAFLGGAERGRVVGRPEVVVPSTTTTTLSAIGLRRRFNAASEASSRSLLSSYLSMSTST